METEVKELLDCLIRAFKKEFPTLEQEPAGFAQAGIGFENFLAIAVTYGGWSGQELPFDLALSPQPALDQLLSNPKAARPKLAPDPKQLGRFLDTFEDLMDRLLKNNKVLWPGFAMFTRCRMPFPRPRTTLLIEPESEPVEYVNRELMSSYPLFSLKKDAGRRPSRKPRAKG